MLTTLETRHVFLDTQVFVAANFQYDSRLLNTLTNYVQANKISLHLTTITIREIENNIHEAVRQAKQAANSMRKNGRILRNCTKTPFENVLRFSMEEITVELIAQFANFLENNRVNIIPIDNVSSSKIFDKYFTNKPPFSEGKKKHEFPDAFSLAALEDWCKSNKEKMYVVSGDCDLIQACKNNSVLITLSKLEELLDKASADIQTHEVAYRLHDYYEDLLESEVKRAYQDSGYWLEDAKGEVYEVYIERVRVLERHLVSVDEKKFSYQSTFKITLSANISYEDLTSMYFDSEEKKHFTLSYIRKTLIRDYICDASIDMYYSTEDVEREEIDYSVDIHIDRPVGLIVHEEGT